MGNPSGPGGEKAATDQATRQRMSVLEAADALGISEDAVRSRIKRGTLTSEREGGRVFVILVGPDRPTDRPGESGALTSATDLIAAKDETIRVLSEQLAEEREARRRADTLLARLMDRVPELEPPDQPPPDERGLPETVEQEPEGDQPRSAAGESQEGARRPWWRRIIGG
jgi:uncharacterized coiled-coil protein SlyX